MVKVIEAVPNFSEGRDPSFLDEVVEAVERVGAEVLDRTADPDHHRSVITFVGDPESVRRASLEAARLAMERIDLRRHQGVHPRVGALDVLPFVPLHDVTMEEAVELAHDVGRAIARMGMPVYFYGRASNPPGRGLAELRRGGFEALAAGFPAERMPDVPKGAWAPHPTAGVTCVGARPVLLAWNVDLEGLDVTDAREIAASIRERGGGFPGLRALGLELPAAGRVQVSMNLEDPERVSPADVFDAIDEEARARGGHAGRIEVIGMIPDALVHLASTGRLCLPDLEPARILSHRLSRHVQERQRKQPNPSDDA